MISEYSQLVDATSIQINWDLPYSNCFKFSVFVDSRMMGENTRATHSTISELTPSTTYNVCVVGRDGYGNTHSNWSHCEDITTASVSGMYCESMYLCG